MTSPFLLYLILSGLMGFHCEVTTVKEVSVKAGSSISIPCLYDSSYSSHVKYLCKGPRWISCDYAVKTDKPDNTGMFSISDDRRQNIFTVVMNDPDSSWYWCAVEKAGSTPDVKKYFWLSVTKDVPSLYVDQQEITAMEGGSVTVLCYHKNLKERRWCHLDGTCVTGQSGSIHETTVTISETYPDAFGVTMSGLRTESSGWYWCDSGDFQMPVHITVFKISSSTVTAANTNTANVGPNTSSPMHSTESQAGGESLQDEPKSFTQTTVLIIALIFLLLLVAAALLGWRIIRRKSKPEASDMTGDSQTGSDSDVQYSEIHHNKGSSVQMKNRIPEDSVTYSTIVMKDHVQQATGTADGSVIYSTVNKNKKNNLE
ncbi:uncharacterized protein LOC141794922 isoform X2 [Halichoeres trimaculatus]|uniref:uncharacterized protein LOC141794922 isoform X2 n=1 Tax=Halichoeres trimaculatus TaxID=147232 RepID=UPI003D9EDF60